MSGDGSGERRSTAESRRGSDAVGATPGSDPTSGDREAEADPAALAAEFDRADLARHLALFYDSETVQLATAAAFLEHGLRAGRKALYLTDVNDPATIRAALGSLGVDVDERTAAGDLTIGDATDVYLEAGFDPERMIATLDEACGEAIEAGYEGLVVAGENSWCFHTEASFDHVLDFEADFDARCPDLPVTALCQYDMDRFGGDSMAKALWTHEQVVYRNTVCENPFYVCPDVYRSTSDPGLDARLMLEQTYSLARARRKVQRREQRLSVLNRILRHDIRNDLNVVDGVLDTLAASGSLDPDEREHVDTASRHVESLLDVAERSRFVRRTLETDPPETTALAPIVDHARTRTLNDAGSPGATVSVADDTDVSVVADRHLDTALAELFGDALAAVGEDDPSRVDVEIRTPTDDTVSIDVRSPGPPLSGELRRLLRRGHETDLEHADDLSLWLAKWILENGHGRLTVPEGDGYRIRVELRRPSG